MKKRIIRIKDISQIDTSKVSVYDLNNRYVDPLGNIFGLKYNKLEKKVRIIKLERLHSSQAVQYQKQLAKAREWDHADDNSHPGHTEDEQTDQYGEDDDIFFDPDVFIEKIINGAETHKERINGIIMNINDSDVFPKENKMESTEFEDIARSLDIDGIQQLEKLDSYYRELSNYPRSITYYQAKIDRDGKEMIDLFSGNKSKTMRFIFLYEISSNIKRIYGSLYKRVQKLDTFTREKNIDEIPGITKHQKQSYTDARTSIENTLTDIDDIHKSNQLLNNYLLNLENY